MGLLVLAEIGDGAYKLFYLLHIVAVVVGIGGVVLNGVYAAQVKARTGMAALAVAEANSFVTWKVAQWFIYAIPIFGFGLIGLSDDVWEFGQTWIWLSLLLYVVAIGLSHGLLHPAEKRFREVLGRSGGAGAGVAPGSVPELVALDKRMAGIGTALNLTVLVILVLMVWKPGI